MLGNLLIMGSSDMELPTKEQLIELLKEKSAVQVKFVKKTTGELRTMLCTLNREVLAQAGAASADAPKPERRTPENLVCAYDVEAAGWRSFDITTVTEVNAE